MSHRYIEDRVEALEKDLADLRKQCALICSKEFESPLTATYEKCAKAYQEEIAKLRMGVKLLHELKKSVMFSCLPNDLAFRIENFLTVNPE